MDPIDYTSYLTSIVTHLESIATSLETIAANSTDIKDSLSTISGEITTMDDHLETMQSVIYDVQDDDTYVGTSSNAKFASGPHIRQIGVGWNDSINDYANNEISRSLMIMSLKDTNKIDVIKTELENPTPLKET